jgi:hypothetical protein
MLQQNVAAAAANVLSRSVAARATGLQQNRRPCCHRLGGSGDRVAASLCRRCAAPAARTWGLHWSLVLGGSTGCAKIFGLPAGGLPRPGKILAAAKVWPF